MNKDKRNQQQNKRKSGSEKKPRKISPDYLHNSGLYYLERFSSCTENFRRVMRRKIIKSCYAHPEQDEEQCNQYLENLIEKFERLELLNDKQYARNQVFSLRRKGKSQRYIMSHLSAKGLTKHHIENALQAYNTENSSQDSEKEAALTFARKKRIGPFRGEKEKDTQKELSALARAGFSYDVARKVIDVDESFEDEPYASSSF